VARVSAEFIKQSDDKASPQLTEQQQKAVKPETNGAAAAAAVPAVVETPKPAATQQDALADLQELRALIDEVRVSCGAWPGHVGACTHADGMHTCPEILDQRACGLADLLGRPLQLICTVCFPPSLSLCKQAHRAQQLYSTFTQEQVDVIFKAAASAASAARIDLAVQVGALCESVDGGQRKQGPRRLCQPQQPGCPSACRPPQAAYARLQLHASVSCKSVTASAPVRGLPAATAAQLNSLAHMDYGWF
jgi:hypothetical protein